jgi:mitogen-activated protein kinase kinase 1
MYPIPPPDISNQIHLFGPQDLDNNLNSLHPMTLVGAKQMSIFELLEYIVNEPVAELPKKIFSDNMRDFVERCMKKDPTERPDLSSLMVRRDICITVI